MSDICPDNLRWPQIWNSGLNFGMVASTLEWGPQLWNGGLNFGMVASTLE